MHWPRRRAPLQSDGPLPAEIGGRVTASKTLRASSRPRRVVSHRSDQGRRGSLGNAGTAFPWQSHILSNNSQPISPRDSHVDVWQSSFCSKSVRCFFGGSAPSAGCRAHPRGADRPTRLRAGRCDFSLRPLAPCRAAVKECWGQAACAGPHTEPCSIFGLTLGAAVRCICIPAGLPARCTGDEVLMIHTAGGLCTRICLHARESTRVFGTFRN